MQLSRRAFTMSMAAGALALGRKPGVRERRVYGPQSLLPPIEILQRNGVRIVTGRTTPAGTEYVMKFDSLVARVQAWDRFNTDPEWCALRESGTLQLRELSLRSSAS